MPAHLDPENDPGPNLAGAAGAFGGPVTLIEPADLVLGGVERTVTTEAAALHRGEAGGPHLGGVTGDDTPDTGVARGVVAGGMQDMWRSYGGCAKVIG